MRKHNNVEVFRITGARQGLADDVRGRQRRYVISMSVRTLSVILAAVLWNVERHVAIVALVLGLLLPYIAVVIANAGRENAPSLPSTFVPTPSRPMLDAPSHTDARTTTHTGSPADEQRQPGPADAADAARSEAENGGAARERAREQG
ncbi:DUF3099 domain-containing protein [Streptomyces sp. Da 82-17]|uniref:DUF3099 domain-containing protein n=1 Tax=Streptomyces sp. Da 82-17 TaxID=3377116 RepID=UPI0038D35EC5